MKAKSQSTSNNFPRALWSLLLATRTRRFATITIAIIAIGTTAFATLSLAQREKRIERVTSTSTAKPASRVEKPERKASSRASDRFKRRSEKFREQEGSALGDQARRERNRDRGPREWKLRRARPFTGDLRQLPQTRPIKSERPEREGPEPNPSRFVPPGETSAPEALESAATPDAPLSAPDAPAPPPTSSFEGLDFNT
ncbi:MAG TPA: hypothetical protein VN844_12910, partial [Pyrinomonadaceae bacterium]|nr:hypothetical protein [Pyrinomonadaceae bacterium]